MRCPCEIEIMTNLLNSRLPAYLEWKSLLTLPAVPIDKRKGLPQSCCVYFVLNVQGCVLYVGQTNNLARRWYRHEQMPQFQAYQATHLAWLPLDGLLLNAIEATFIAALKPPCNTTNGAKNSRWYGFPF